MRIPLIALALTVAAVQPAAAQARNSSGMARTTAVLEWTTETRYARSVSSVMRKDGSAVLAPGELQKETGSLTMVLEMLPEQLPGGVVSRTLNGTPHMVGWTPPMSLPPAQSRLVSIAGRSAIEGSMQEPDRCRTVTEGEMAGRVDPAGATLRGSLNYTQQNSMVTIVFRDTVPIGFSFGTTDSLPRTATVTYACGGTSASNPGALQGNELGVSVDAASGWTVRTRRNGEQWVMTAEKTEPVTGYEGTVKRTASLKWTQPRATAPPQPPASTPTLTAGRGTITFTQGGQQATWLLNSKTEQGAGGMVMKVLLFTVDGNAPDGSKGTLALSWMNMGGQPQLAALSVTAGPRGDSEYDMSTSRCTIKLLADGGEGTCTGGFSGAVVSRFTFKVQP